MMKRSTENVFKLNSADKWLRVMLAVTVMISLVFIGFAESVNAAGAIQIAGIGYFDDVGACDDPEGAGADFATILTGDLEGCQYVFVTSFDCSPSGTYREEGTEVYVLDGPDGQGTFSTTYFFRGKFEGCAPDGGFVGAEIMGFCQHPIVAGSGTGDYEGVTGRLHFKDDVAAGNFPYTGHLKW
jgi:hypothetical protein